MKRLPTIISLLLLLSMGLWGQKNPAIEKQLKNKYDRAYYYSGCYMVKIGDKEGVCDLDGNEIIAPDKYTSVVLYSSGYYGVKIGDKEGACDLDGNEIIEPDKYTSVILYPSGYYGVKMGDKKGACDLDGNEVVPCLFASLVKNDDNTYSYKNSKEGEWENYTPNPSVGTTYAKNKPKAKRATTSSDKTASKEKTEPEPEIIDIFGIYDKETQTFRPNKSKETSYEKSPSIKAFFNATNKEDRYSVCFYPAQGTQVPKVYIKASEPSGDTYTFHLSDCHVYGGEMSAPMVATPGILKPGYTVSIYGQSDDKILFFEQIPESGTPEYASFKGKLEKNNANNQKAILYFLNFQNIQPFQNTQTPSNNSGSSKSASSCSMCEGKGWIKGASTPTYGNTGTHWCEECGENVNASHSHDVCPSCGGRGVR